MLTITIGEKELFNEETSEFQKVEGTKIVLEHSLVSISKWESKWGKSYLNTKKMTPEEVEDYIMCMIISPNVDSSILKKLSKENIEEITDYIHHPMTATTFLDKSKRINNQIITSELIYYWMIAQNIPIKCETWHLNKLLTLIRVCSIESNPKKKKKINPNDLLADQYRLNKQRQAEAAARRAAAASGG